MAFHWDIKHWATLGAFQAHLATLSQVPWARGLTVHHTWKPTQSQWTGKRSMQALERYYRGKGWSAGPHLFICVGSPNRANDGIWQGTPIRTRGIHAGICNTSRWGVEVVGNFDSQPWSPELTQLVEGTIEALFRWRKLGGNQVNGHHECGSDKSCPGDAIDLDALRRRMTARLAQHSTPPTGGETYEIVVDRSLVRAQATRNSSDLRVLSKGALVTVTEIVLGERYLDEPRWAKLQGGGYMWLGLLRQVKRG